MTLISAQSADKVNKIETVTSFMHWISIWCELSAHWNDMKARCPLCVVYFVVNIRTCSKMLHIVQEANVELCMLPLALGQPTGRPLFLGETNFEFICQWSCRQCTRLQDECSPWMPIAFAFQSFISFFSAFNYYVFACVCVWQRNVYNLLQKVWL